MSKGKSTSIYAPQIVHNSQNYKSICARGGHTCAIRHDGMGFCWGGNANGELGIGVIGGRKAVPAQLPGSWKQIACGLRYTCGIDQAVSLVGRLLIPYVPLLQINLPSSIPILTYLPWLYSLQDELYCWGAMAGLKGTAFQTFGPVAKKVGGKFKWKTISAGTQHLCGLLADKTARCFGLGWHGQLGNGLNTTLSQPYAKDCPSKAPCEPKGGGKWRSISAGDYNTCGVRVNGYLYCFGDNPYGSLGNGKVGGHIYSPTKVLEP